MMMQPPGSDLLEQYLDSVHRFILTADDPELKQELLDVSDALESGSITLDTALFWEHDEARRILRKAFSDAGFLIMRLEK
ncbi:hypothetical protein [Bacillus sp. ISL-55]|uniref:hypothetical protein n=1 Tax=Bacillus sp. ISL-55 TaxID=2819134 RepID=UPI001BEADA63|nr:hypothetical protein [Bacillus sp. ISL-55]MBT2692694.1 hypothetical protein [Bacillus sp. ISL-55]